MCQRGGGLKKIVVFLFLISFCAVLYGAKSYTILSRGIVQDNSTRLLWTRCPISGNGKPIYDFNCKGERKLFSWSEGVDTCENLDHEGRSDWRLPNVKELQSLIYYVHYTESDSCSQINNQAFPNVVLDSECTVFESVVQYWSSTVHNGRDVKNLNYIWLVDFKFGTTAFASQNVYNFSGEVTGVNKKYVRCVAGP